MTQPLDSDLDAGTVHVVDDCDSAREAAITLLEASGIHACGYASAQAFLDVCTDDTDGCLLLDLNLPGMNGIALQETLRERGIELPIVFLTGSGDLSTAIQAVKGGAIDFLRKPTSPDLLLARIREALKGTR